MWDELAVRLGNAKTVEVIVRKDRNGDGGEVYVKMKFDENGNSVRLQA